MCSMGRGSEAIECSYSHLLLALLLLRVIIRVHHPDGLAEHLRLHSSSVLGVKQQGGTFAHAAARRIAPAAAAVLLDRVVLPNLHLHLRG